MCYRVRARARAMASSLLPAWPHRAPASRAARAFILPLLLPTRARRRRSVQPPLHTPHPLLPALPALGSAPVLTGRSPRLLALAARPASCAVVSAKRRLLTSPPPSLPISLPLPPSLFLPSSLPLPLPSLFLRLSLPLSLPPSPSPRRSVSLTPSLSPSPSPSPSLSLTPSFCVSFSVSFHLTFPISLSLTARVEPQAQP